ncbi:MAG: 50S ribosomal protein L44e [Candidatus Diapherotrites archaeon]|nr:50S ribosomal protein L44e [Candidatus Diapherotrites archaeon]
MKMPEEIMVYCPFCKKRSKHKVKVYKKGKTRSVARGQKRHEEKGRGYTSKIAGKVTVYKQAKNPTVMLTCSVCKKKHPKTIGTRTKKVLELKKV